MLPVTAQLQYLHYKKILFYEQRLQNHTQDLHLAIKALLMRYGFHRIRPPFVWRSILQRAAKQRVLSLLDHAGKHDLLSSTTNWCSLLDLDDLKGWINFLLLMLLRLLLLLASARSLCRAS